MGANATASVADVIDSCKFTAVDLDFALGITYGSDTITDRKITLGKFIENSPGFQVELQQILSYSSGSLILRIGDDDNFESLVRDIIPVTDPTTTFDHVVFKDSSGAEIAEIEMLASLQNNASSNRLFTFVDDFWFGGITGNRPKAIEVTVIDADTFTFPLTFTVKNRVVPSDASETFTGSTGKVHKASDLLSSTAGTAIASSSLSSNVVTINTSSSHGLSSGDKVDITGIGFSGYNPNTVVIPNLSGGYGGSALFVAGQDYTIEFRNRL
jgi:hypothetical protein